MVPRYDDGKDVTTGFVCYDKRAEAEVALRKMDGVVINGKEIRVGWAKQPAKDKLKTHDAGTSRDRDRDRDRDSHRHPPSHTMMMVPPPPPPGFGGMPPHLPLPPRNLNIPPGAPIITVILPPPERRTIIDNLSKLVVEHGQEFEQTLMDREPNNPNLQFLFLAGSPENMYYRWRVFTLFHGDTLERWREEPFQMFVNGPFWIPPPGGARTSEPRAPSVTPPRPVTAISGPASHHLGKPLSDRDRDAFEDILRSLTISRRAIRDAMGFSLDHSESAPEIVQVITEALTIPETPTQTKVARLFLISDILHNTSIAKLPNLHLFRSGFEATLPMIFKSFNQKLNSITGRISRSTFQVRCFPLFLHFTTFSSI
jgi:U2-associated protein SR140